MNLLDLFNSIEGIKSFEYKRDMIDELESENPKLFQKYKIVIEKSSFIFFNKNLLPKITILEKNVLINAAFEIFTNENTNIDFESKVKELTNNE
jgi:ABC-type lipoprotein export system ATPase subunit